jgi:rhomboid family protein
VSFRCGSNRRLERPHGKAYNVRTVMFLPVGDQPNPPGTPFVNYTLIALNVAVYLLVSLPLQMRPADPRDPRLREYIDVVAQNLPPGTSVQEVVSQVSAYDLVVFSYGYRPAEPSVLTLFTAMFLHGGFAHLFGNMLFLWIYGDNVEHRLGRVGYLFWYLATGVAATLFFALLDGSSKFPMVGASGAISGVLGFYFLWFPHNLVRVWVFLFPFFMNVVALPARLVLGAFLVIDNLLPFLVSGGAGTGVAYGAHIGGFVAGLSAAWVMNRRSNAAGFQRAPDVSEKPLPSPSPSPSSSSSPRDELAAAMDRRDYERASEIYFRLSSEETRGVLSPDESIALGNWLAKNGHARPALTLYQRHLRDYPRGPGVAEAHAYAGLIQLHALNEPTAAYQHLVEALDNDPPPELESLVRNGLAQIEERQRFRAPRLRN